MISFDHVTYTYEGSLVGSARAKVSEKYKKEHTANIKKQEKNSDKNSDNKEDTSGKIRRSNHMSK